MQNRPPSSTSFQVGDHLEFWGLTGQTKAEGTSEPLAKLTVLSISIPGDICVRRDDITTRDGDHPLINIPFNEAYRMVEEKILQMAAKETPKLPHSRACGHVQHPHGLACSRDCPTCHGVPGREVNGEFVGDF